MFNNTSKGEEKMVQNAPGRSFLKVTGILCIIYGAVLLLSSVSSIFVYTQLTSGKLSDEVMDLYEQMNITASSLLLCSLLPEFSEWRTHGRSRGQASV